MDVVLDEDQYPVYQGSRSEVAAWLIDNDYAYKTHTLAVNDYATYVSVPEYLGHGTPAIVHTPTGGQRGICRERYTAEKTYSDHHRLQDRLRMLLAGSRSQGYTRHPSGFLPSLRGDRSS